MLNLKLQNLLSIINFCILFLSFMNIAYSQNTKMERLELQYKLLHTSSNIEKDVLTLDVANKFLSQGDYQNGITFNEKVKPNLDNKDFKKLVF